MASGARVRIDGGAVRRLARPGGPAVAAVVSRAEDVVATAQRLVKVRSGDLRDSIDYELRADADGVYAAVSYGADQFYGAFQELGTRRTPARPFLRPATD